MKLVPTAAGMRYSNRLMLREHPEKDKAWNCVLIDIIAICAEGVIVEPPIDIYNMQIGINLTNRLMYGIYEPSVSRKAIAKAFQKGYIRVEE